MWLFEPRRRKSKAQRKREKGRRSYRKGEQFEKKTYPFLARQGFKVTKSRVRSRIREEFDGLATDRYGHTHAVEVKATKQKVNVAVVRNLRRKVSHHKGLLHGGIIVSKSGFTKSAEQEAKKHGIKTLKYKRKRRQETGWLF